MKNNQNYECAIITGATAVLMREAFNDWNRGQEALVSDAKRKVIVSAVMYNATTMLVFYYVPD
jgi:hypothetical protein